MSGGWVTRERSFRGISARLALKYLESLGGEQVGENRVEADDWEAEFSSETATVGRSFKVNQIDIVFQGNPEVLDEYIEKFAQKAIRAGG
jgi:hypothetical protein